MDAPHGLMALWDELDRQWWRLDGGYVAIIDSVRRGTAGGDAFERIVEIRRQQDGIIEQMDKVLLKLAILNYRSRRHPGAILYFHRRKPPQ